MDKNTPINNESNEELMDSLMEELEKLYDKEQRISDELDKENAKYTKLLDKTNKLNTIAEDLAKNTDKIIKKIELARTSRVGTIVLTFVFSLLFAITKLNPIMLISFAVSAISTQILSSYISKKIQAFDKNKEKADKIVELFEMYKEEESYIRTKKDRLTNELNETFNKFLDINEQLDALEGVNSLTLLKEDLDKEIASLTDDEYEEVENKKNINPKTID